MVVVVVVVVVVVCVCVCVVRDWACVFGYGVVDRPWYGSPIVLLMGHFRL